LDGYCYININYILNQEYESIYQIIRHNKKTQFLDRTGGGIITGYPVTTDKGNKKMNDMNFSLKPFQPEEISHKFRINGSIGREPGRLKLLYELKGALNKLAIPHSSGEPKRRDRLWQETCFELFLNINDSDTYWELNLSPSGDWNIYRFSAYREGMQEEKAFINLPFMVKNGPEILRLVFELNTDRIIPPDRAINVAVSAVLKSIRGNTTYWALAHHGAKPDFHRRDGFLIEL
jgi:hypothetical protein